MQYAFVFQFLDGGRIGRIPVDVDDAWLRSCERVQGLAQEALRSSRVPLGSEQKLDGLARGVDRSIEIPVSAFDLDVRLIDPPAFANWLEVRSASLVQFRRVLLDPAPEAAAVHPEAALLHHLGDMCVRQRKP